MNKFPKEVVCINDNWYNQFGEPRDINNLPRKGQVYTATREVPCYFTTYYSLQGFSFFRLFITSYFVDLDTIDISEIKEVLNQEPCLI